MHIVPASVHHTCMLRLVGNVILFYNGQCIHICPKGDNFLTGVFPFDESYHTRCGLYLKWDTPIF